MRVRRVLGAAAFSALTLITVLTSAAAGSVSRAPAASLTVATAQPVRYVALGDSYSAGTGSGPYGAGAAGRSCERSADAFPALWAGRHHPASFVSAAFTAAAR